MFTQTPDSYSLGISPEWKHRSAHNECVVLAIPTRQGYHLNGNVNIASSVDPRVIIEIPTRQGYHLNGNNTQTKMYKSKWHTEPQNSLAAIIIAAKLIKLYTTKSV